MLLSTHRLISGIAEFNPGSGPSDPFVYSDNEASFRQRLNNSMGSMEDFIETIEVNVEDTMAATFGTGVIYGLAPTAGTGLNIDYTAGRAIIGLLIEKDADSISVPDDYSPGYVYMKQDGTFEVNDTGTAPSDVESFLLCTFTSSGGSVSNVDTSTREPQTILPAKMRRITGVSNAVVPLHSVRTYEVVHSYSIEIPGYITISTDEPTVDVEVVNIENATATSFYIQLTHDSGGASYEYEYYTDDSYYGYTVEMDWVRTGLGYASS